jgi:hypothetical protein
MSNDNSLSELKKINDNLKLDNDSLISILSKSSVQTTPTAQNTNITNTTQNTENLTSDSNVITNYDNRQNINNETRNFTNVIPPTSSFDLSPLTSLQQELLMSNNESLSELKRINDNLITDSEKLVSFLSRNITPESLTAQNTNITNTTQNVEYKAPIVQTPEIPVAMNNMFNSVTEKMVETRVNSSSDVKYDGRLSIDINVNAPNGVDKNTVAETIQKMLYDDKVRKNIEESVIGGKVGNYNSSTGIPV